MCANYDAASELRNRTERLLACVSRRRSLADVSGLRADPRARRRRTCRHGPGTVSGFRWGRGCGPELPGSYSGSGGQGGNRGIRPLPDALILVMLIGDGGLVRAIAAVHPLIAQSTRSCSSAWA